MPADELKVLSAGTMHFALKDVGDNFTRKTGTKLAITFGSANGIKTKFEKGEPADVAILPKPDTGPSTYRSRRLKASSIIG